MTVFGETVSHAGVQSVYTVIIAISICSYLRSVLTVWAFLYARFAPGPPRRRPAVSNELEFGRVHPYS